MTRFSMLPPELHPSGRFGDGLLTCRYGRCGLPTGGAGWEWVALGEDGFEEAVAVFVAGGAAGRVVPEVVELVGVVAEVVEFAVRLAGVVDVLPFSGAEGEDFETGGVEAAGLEFVGFDVLGIDGGTGRGVGGSGDEWAEGEALHAGLVRETEEVEEGGGDVDGLGEVMDDAGGR